MAYKAYITKIKDIKEHLNADNINLATCYGNQVVIGKDIKEGTLGVYFPSDGKLFNIFLKENNLYRHKELNLDQNKAGFFEDNGRIRVQKFRGEESDGIWLPIDCLDFVGKHKLKEGDEFNKINSIEICEKYINHKTKKQGSGKEKNKKFNMKKMFPLFKEHKDTEQYSYNSFKIKEGSIITFSEKLHGTSGRSSYTIVKRNRIIEILFGWLLKPTWKYICGTRRVILYSFKKKKTLGFYGTNEFRQEHHVKFIDKLYKGETVYYEIVGWVNESKPIMGRCKNKKLKDKDFIKKYGDETIFNYGCNTGKSDIYVYRISITDEKGFIKNLTDHEMRNRCKDLNVKPVPFLQRIVYDGNLENLNTIVNDICDGESVITPDHIREGVVLRIEQDNKFFALKHKNFTFKLLEGIIKDSDQVDIEEVQEV